MENGMKKYITLFALAVSVVGLAITVREDDWFMIFVITTCLLQILISRAWK